MKVLKGKYSAVLLLILQFLIGCEIVEETKFEKGGNGIYSLGFDMSAIMEMGMGSKGKSFDKQLDTIIEFSKFLEEKKDSISKLSKEDRKKLKELENFRLSMLMDSVSQKYEIKLGYEFEDIKDLKLLGEKLMNQKIKELQELKGTSKDDKVSKELLNINTKYVKKFSKRNFSSTLTDSALKEAVESRDSTLTKDSPMVKMVQFKTVYKFPYRIKKVSNENAKILSDFKGVEISGNLYDINNNPRYYDVEVEFER